MLHIRNRAGFLSSAISHSGGGKRRWSGARNADRIACDALRAAGPPVMHVRQTQSRWTACTLALRRGWCLIVSSRDFLFASACMRN